jgi:hypothetical protein
MSASEAHSRVAGKDAAAAKQRPRSRAAGAAPPAPLPALPTVPRAANPAATQQPKFWLGAPEAVHPRYDRLQHADMDLDEARALRQRLQRAYQPRRPRQRMPAAFLGTFQRRANHSCLPPPARGAPRPAEQNAAADLAAQGAPAVAAAEGGADADAGPPAAAAIDREGIRAAVAKAVRGVSQILLRHILQRNGLIDRHTLVSDPLCRRPSSRGTWREMHVGQRQPRGWATTSVT